MSDSTDNELYRSVGRLFFSILNREPIGTQMSALTDAVAAFNASKAEAVDRINTDVAHLRQLLDEALAANVGDDAEIERLTNEADDAVTNITAATDALNLIDPDASFPTPDEG